VNIRGRFGKQPTDELSLEPHERPEIEGLDELWLRHRLGQFDEVAIGERSVGGVARKQRGRWQGTGLDGRHGWGRERVLRRLTFDMRGGRQWAKPAVGRPLDGRVRPAAEVRGFSSDIENGRHWFRSSTFHGRQCARPLTQ